MWSSGCALSLHFHNEGAARNKAQDCTNGIHTRIEYRANHMYKLSCAEYHIRITVKTLRPSGWCGQNQRKGVMRKLDCAEFEQKHSRLSSKLTNRACHAIHNQRVVLTAQENPTPTHVLHPRRAVPLLLLGVCEGARSFHDDMEQLMTLSGGFFLREGGR